MAQALYRKWRPQKWQDVIGQDHIIQTLRNAVTAGRVAHAYLFAGPRGTGKTTTARLLAKAVNCLHDELGVRPCDTCDHCLAVNQGRFLDLIEIDAASNTSVEDVRDLREKINFSPNQGRYKVYIIDEVHMLSTAAFNALLKTLEEPPPHAIFVLATTEIHKIPATVLSRCQRHEFRRIPLKEMVEYLEKMAGEEGLQVDRDAVMLVARQSTGCLRDAISLLDQLSSGGEAITLEMALHLLGVTTNQLVVEIVESLVKEDVTQGLEHIHRALDGGSDPRQFARQLVEYLRDVLLVKMGQAVQVDAGAEVREVMAHQAEAISLERLLAMIKVFNQAATELRSGWQPALPLEMALVESLRAGAARPTQEMPPLSQRSSASPEGAPKTPTKPGEVVELFQSGIEKPKAESSVATDPESEEMYAQVVSNWRRVLDAVKNRSNTTHPFLNSCKLLGMRKGVLLIGYNGDFVRQQMETDEHRSVVETVLEEIIGTAIPVRGFVAGNRRGEIPLDVDIDGMVAAALRDLGGKIVDVQGGG
jgi:DNA polymerase III subunit gamma/tau